MDRRHFLAASAAALPLPGAVAANDRIRLGIIGPGNRGSLLIRWAMEVGGIEWVAVADVYARRLDEAEQRVKTKLRKYADYRQLLDSKDIDAVIIATPDQWHARMIIDAVRAGKDVFCEKPMTASAMQGHAVVKAVRETKRIVQIGTQQRSLPVVREAKAKFIDSGLMGHITMVHCEWNWNGGYSRFVVPADMRTKPADLDWNAWLGPLPKVPYDGLRFLRAAQFWGPSTGPAGNLLVHYLDIVHWYLDVKRPETASAMGGIFELKDGRDVPDTYSSILRYPEGLLVSFDCCPVDTSAKEATDLVFVGTGGRLHVFRNGYRFLPSEANKAMGEIAAPGKDGLYHIKNWFDCIRSREQPNANVVDGHYLAAACHLSSAAFFQNRHTYWDEAWDLMEG